MERPSKLSKIVAHARRHSPFYAELYAGLPDHIENVEQLPVLDMKAFWASNGLSDNRVLTSRSIGGIALRSGGSTGSPKYSVFSRDEWVEISSECAKGLNKAGLADGDRIANLGGVGDLSAGFVFYGSSIFHTQPRVVEYPIGGHTPMDRVCGLIQDCGINAVIGASSLLTRFFQFLNDHRGDFSRVAIEKAFFFGEHLFPDQAAIIRSGRSHIKIASAGHTAVDVGVMGYSAMTERYSEHRVFADQMILEILDLENNQPIREIGRQGKLVVTNLIRKTMPILRYSVGDICEWSEAPGREDRSYVLLGRSPEAWSLASASFSFQDIEDVVKKLDSTYEVSNFQIVLRRIGTKEKLTIRLGVPLNRSREVETAKVAETFCRLIPKLGLVVASKEAHPVEIEWRKPEDLALNQRTGKLIRIIDERT